MHATDTADARICGENHVLVAPSTLDVVVRDFCGSVVVADDPASGLPDVAGKTVFLCGDVSRVRGGDLDAAERVFVVRGLSRGYDDGNGHKPWTLVDPGRVPVLVHGVGVYYRRFFDSGVDRFARIHAEHAFQSLTESTKPGVARRTGVYLTPVRQDDEGLHFRLLRCSTNFAGPTEDFGATDWKIVNALNQEAAAVFQNPAPLNHVLAQIYHNAPAGPDGKSTKARISAHADKTKDMPANGLIAFCTFYDGLDKLSPLADDPFDFGRKGVSGLTRLHFRWKEPHAERPESLPAHFTLTLYPDSVFFMPLSTNRLYTHEIRSSSLDAGSLPTRLGYVVRCSKTEAVHKEGRTFLKASGSLTELASPSPEGMDELRRLYAEENATQGRIDYGDRFPFSMNSGDYLAPRK